MNKIKIKMKLIALVSIFIIFVPYAFAKDLGVYGETFPIIEEDFLEFIQKRILAMQERHQWETFQQNLKSSAERHADRPRPLEKITKCHINKTWKIDLTIETEDNILNDTGEVIIKKGTRINPLHYITLHSVLIFIDGDDVEETRWAERKIKNDLNKSKLVLVKGSIKEVEKRFLQAVYFDQEGRLTTKFHIEHVPALVSQDKQDSLSLKVEEVAL